MNTQISHQLENSNLTQSLKMSDHHQNADLTTAWKLRSDTTSENFDLKPACKLKVDTKPEHSDQKPCLFASLACTILQELIFTVPWREIHKLHYLIPN